MELIQISRAPSQPAPVFPSKNGMRYGTYLTEIKEREERNRQLQKGEKKQSKKIQRKLQVLGKKLGLVVYIRKVASLKRHACAINDVISISF